MSTTHGNYINGTWIDSESGKTFDVLNPSNTDEVVRRYQDSTMADVEAAIEAAVATQDEWATTPEPERGAILKQAGQLLEERKEETTTMLVREEGKTQSEAAGEVQRAIDIFAYYAQKARDLGGVVKSPSSPKKEIYTKREPLGTVGLITPWNYPDRNPCLETRPRAGYWQYSGRETCVSCAQRDTDHCRVPRRGWLACWCCKRCNRIWERCRRTTN